MYLLLPADCVNWKIDYINEPRYRDVAYNPYNYRDVAYNPYNYRDVAYNPYNYFPVWRADVLLLLLSGSEQHEHSISVRSCDTVGMWWSLYSPAVRGSKGMIISTFPSTLYVPKLINV